MERLYEEWTNLASLLDCRVVAKFDVQHHKVHLCWALFVNFDVEIVRLQTQKMNGMTRDNEMFDGLAQIVCHFDRERFFHSWVFWRLDILRAVKSDATDAERQLRGEIGEANSRKRNELEIRVLDVGEADAKYGVLLHFSELVIGQFFADKVTPGRVEKRFEDVHFVEVIHENVLPNALRIDDGAGRGLCCGCDC